MIGFGEHEAQRLLDAGWRQGSVFSPNEWVGAPQGLATDELLVVLSQSCTVVSERLHSDPFVEVAVAKREAKFAPRSPAALGKNFRKLLLPMDAEGYAAIEIDVNQRAFVDRALLLNFGPDEAQPSAAATRIIGGWMGRIYSRIALPNALVVALRETCIPALKGAMESDFEGAPASERIIDIFAQWEPDDESGGPYRINFLIAATDYPAAEAVDKILRETFPLKTPGLHVSHECDSAEQMLYSQTRARAKFSDLDYLSNLADEGWRT